MKGARIVVLGFLAIVLCVYFYLSVFGPDEFVWRNRVRQGNQVAKKLEAFRQEHRRLPESLPEMGITVDESGPVFYEKCTDAQYVLWFGTTLGESMTYDTTTGKWRGGNHTCPPKAP
jgi:hypothetical protein